MFLQHARDAREPESCGEASRPRIFYMIWGFKIIFLLLHWANEHDHLRLCSEMVPPKWRSLFDFSPSCAQHHTDTRWSPGLNTEAGVCQTFTHTFVSATPSWNRLVRTYRSFWKTRWSVTGSTTVTEITPSCPRCIQPNFIAKCLCC